MNAPQVPQFERKSFPDVPWLPKFYDFLKPFLEAVSQALGTVASPVVLGEGLSVTTKSDGEFASPAFIPSAELSGLMLATAIRLDAQGRDTGEKVTVTCSWRTGSQGSVSGLLVTGATGLAPSSRYALTVWGISR